MKQYDRPSVLIVINDLKYGGTEKHLLSVLPKLKQNTPWDLKVFTFGADIPIADKFRQEGIQILSPSRSFPTLSKGLHEVFVLVHSMIRLSKVIKDERPGSVHFYLPKSYILGSIVTLLLGQKRIVMHRRSLNDYQKKHRLLAKVERWLHRCLALAVGNSKAVIEQLETEGIPKEKIRLIYNGVDCERFPQIQGKNESQTGTKLIVVANLFPYKGHQDLLQALSLIKDRLPEHWQLQCIGRDQGTLGELKQQAQFLGIHRNVEWLGEQYQIVNYLREADIGLLCSHEEGFSNSILEKMAAGLPLVVTNVGGNVEAVIDGENGFVVPPKAPERLGEAILNLVNNPDLREMMRQNNLRRVQQHFSIENTVAAYEKLYNELLGE